MSLIIYPKRMLFPRVLTIQNIRDFCKVGKCTNNKRGARTAEIFGFASREKTQTEATVS